MSKSAPWKDLERRHARRLGVARIWRQDFGEVAPDGETDAEIWDCKCYAAFSVITMFLKREKDYKKFANGRHFHLCLFSRKHRRGGDFVLSRAERYAELLEKERYLASLHEHSAGGLFFAPGYPESPEERPGG